MKHLFCSVKTLSAFFFFAVSFTVFSQDIRYKSYTGNKPVSEKTLFSFGVGFAPKIQIGTGVEYVFQDYDYVLSKLVWPLLPSAGFQAYAELYSKSGFHAVFTASFSLQHMTGKTADYDFTNNADKKMLTKFSLHHCMLEYGRQYCFSAGWIMPLIEYFRSGEKIKIYAEPCIGVRYYAHMWTAADGYLQYSGSDTESVFPDTPKINFKGKAAQYTQTLILPNIGILFKFDLPKKWNIKTAVQLCPQTVGLCEDIHFGRDIIFYDIFNLKGFSFHLDFFAEKKLNTVLSAFFSIDCGTAVSYNGMTFVRSTLTKRIISIAHEEASGTALYTADLSLGFLLRFGR